MPEKQEIAKQPCDAVIFDLWGTLIDQFPPNYREVGEKVAQLLGVSSSRIDDYRRSTQEQRLAGGFSSLDEQIDHMLRSMGCEPQDALRTQVRDAQLAFFRAALDASPQVLRVLADLRKAGLAVGLISNCSHDIPSVWEESALSGYVSHPVFSAVECLAKPGGEIYRLACTRLGVAPERSLFVDDQVEFLVGAQSVGLTGVLISPDGSGCDDWSGERITSLPEIRRVVEQAL